MLAKSNPNFLLASNEPALLSKLEPLLEAQSGQVHIALTAEAALALLAGPLQHNLLLLDANLPGLELGQFLATVQVAAGEKSFPIVLISDTISEEMIDRLAEGVIADIVPGCTERLFWQVRIGNALRSHQAAGDLDLLRESAVVNAQFDRLTGVYNRETMLAMLFRETDRVQRMRSSLCMILFDVDDFGHWNSRLGAEVCDDLLCQIVGRANRLLRSYDTLGRVGKDEFLVSMPGCSAVNAVMLAERLRAEVFSEPFHVAGEAVRLSASFGISSSNGRSPLVVLREAEQALSWSRSSGPESIECFCECPQPEPAPVTFFSPASGDEVLAW
jgi:two-component system cell cycle response regulator